MKALASILSIYIMVLLALPCVDVIETKDMASITAPQECPLHQHGDLDQCSPFCTCSCCTAPVMTHSWNPDFSIVSVGEIILIKGSISLEQGTVQSIWQPPNKA